LLPGTELDYGKILAGTAVIVAFKADAAENMAACFKQLVRFVNDTLNFFEG
jgi:hypothetical protein